MSPTIAGSLAGFVATAPMTGVMLALHRRLPRHEQYPLPQRLITMRVADRVGIRDEMNEDQRTAATYAAHFAYGLSVGALYGLMAPRLPGPAAARGIGFGLAVWAGSYLGWLPAANLLRPATQEPAERNGMIIAAHVVWGAATGLLTEALAHHRRSS